MIRILFSLLISIISITTFAENPNNNNTHPKREHCSMEQRAQWKKEYCEQKINYIIQEMELTDNEKQIFLPLYSTFMKEIDESKRKIKQAKRSAEIEDPSYTLVLDIIVKEFDKMDDLRKSLHNNLLKHFTSKQVYMYYKAEDKFNRLLIKQIEKQKK